MKKVLRVLEVEDSTDDMLLVLHQLKIGGYNTDYERLDSAEKMKIALAFEFKNYYFNELPRSRADEVSLRNFIIIDASIGVLYLFIPIRFAIGIIPFGHEIALLSSFNNQISGR
jgi:hypothetical protein